MPMTWLPAGSISCNTSTNSPKPAPTSSQRTGRDAPTTSGNIVRTVVA